VLTYYAEEGCHEALDSFSYSEDSATCQEGEDDDSYMRVRAMDLLSFAAHDAYQRTQCCIRRLCTNSGETTIEAASHAADDGSAPSNVRPLA
jgi:hypothetical protein